MITADQASQVMRQAIALQEQDKHREAFELYSVISESFPNHPDVLHNSGLAKLALGEFDAAERLLLSALKLRPRFDKARSNLVKLWTRMDREATLSEIATDAAWISALDFDAGLALGRHFYNRGEHYKSCIVLQRCVEVRPADAPARRLLGVTLDRLHRVDEAEVHLREALKLAPENPVILADLSHCMFSKHMKSRRPEYLTEGRSLIEHAVRLAPGNAHVRHQMGLTHEEDGDFEKAMQSYAEALSITPDYLPALTSLAAASRSAISQGLLDDLESALEKGKGRFPASEQSRAHQVLGKCRDARGEFDRAFEHFRRSNMLAPNPLPYDRRRQEAYAGNLMETYSSRNIGHEVPADAEICRPVFVVGMPRSGTTLLEHMLSSHPEIAGAGELGFFSSLELAGKSLHARDGKRCPDWEERVSHHNLERLRSEYAALIDTVDTNSRYVIDKMPFNFWHIGVILSVFPDARIIHCTRDRYDVCLSCYIESFSEFHGWSLDLADTGHYWRQYELIMAHWRDLFGKSILEIQYEKVVEDHRQVIRDALDFLNLSWDDSVASYNASNRSIQTPSNWQVRQPLYRSSVGRWRNYRQYLGPLFEGLGDRQASIIQGQTPDDRA